MRGGRINFKFGDAKSVFYFNDADLDVSPSKDSVNLRFSGAPSRTDQAAQNFGHFFVRGVSRTVNGEPRLDMKIELERRAIDEISRVFDRRGFGVHGVVAFEAQLSGPPSHLEVSGRLKVDDVHRWDLLPQRGGGWSFGYSGLLDLNGETLALQSTTEESNAPLDVRLLARNLLSTPQWSSETQLKKTPAAVSLQLLRHMIGNLPEQLAATAPPTLARRYSCP